MPGAYAICAGILVGRQAQVNNIYGATCASSIAGKISIAPNMAAFLHRVDRHYGHQRIP